MVQASLKEAYARPEEACASLSEALVKLVMQVFLQLLLYMSTK